uniref:Interferon-related developmental regulator N-terminal domain-containing protein n=2 Tax=Aegilops tauschii TaxID=37682 RepID=A0A453Q0T5_AEGTS
IKSSRADNRTAPRVLITALSAWALLLTTLGDLRTYPYAWKEATIPFRDLAELLNTDDPALLMASGEALAVCAELNLMQHATPEDMETLEIKVSDLASGTHGNDKKLTGQIRAMFQQIAAIMKRGQCSDEELVPTTWRQRCVLMVSKWARLVQLNFVKRFLGKCFDKHIHDNPLFRESSFNNVATNETSDLPVKKSKQHKFGREKQYTVALKRDRMISWESKNDFLLL